MSGSLTPGLESLSGKFFSTSSKTVNATTETSIIPSGVGDLMVPGNWFLPGRNLRLVARGTVTTPLISIGSSTIRVKLGGATIASASTVSILGGLTNQYFRVICNIQCYNSGSSGMLAIAGEIGYPTGLAGAQQGNQPLDNSAITMDTTQPLSIDVTAQWTLANHALKTTIFTAELMKMDM